jgi:hypothetical protein
VTSSGALAVPDDDRLVDLSDDTGGLDDEPVLPGTTRDDTDAGWGEHHRDNDDRLRDERPPHWD